MMEPVRETAYGKVKGSIRGGVEIYRGIPYADSVGNRRFLPALPPKPWAGVRDCTRNGFYCPQAGVSITASWDFGDYFSGGHPERFGCYEELQGEECLNLNILTKQGAKGLPVIVYIHGGGFAAGSGTLVLGADRLVDEQDVVVVGINHRLNAFGYLYLGHIDIDYAQSGSAGITDLILALEWIRENIAAFGGDPDNVTLIGESGGGIKIATLLSMPRSRGLVRRAVMESAFGKPGRHTPQKAAEVTGHFLYLLGIKDNVIERLKGLRAEHIKEAAIATGLFALEPVADGISIPYNTENCFPMADPGVSVLIGTSEDETAAFASEEEHEVKTREEVTDRLVRGCGPAWMHLKNLDEETAGRLYEVFRENDKKHVDNAHLLMKINSMCGPLETFSFEHAVDCSRRIGAPVYRYINAYDAPHRILPDKFCAWHGAELPLQFRIVRHPQCEEMSRQLSLSLANYARTSDPSFEDVVWKPFGPDKETMIIDTKWEMADDPTLPYRSVWQGM